MRHHTGKSIIARRLPLLICLATSVAASAAATAEADHSREVVFADARTQVVQYNASDLATRHGQSALHSRIEEAAKVVCGDPYARDLREAYAFRKCVVKAVDDAWGQVQSAASGE